MAAAALAVAAARSGGKSEAMDLPTSWTRATSLFAWTGPTRAALAGRIRLSNLAYYQGPPVEVIDERLEAAIKQFQVDQRVARPDLKNSTYCSRASAKMSSP